MLLSLMIIFIFSSISLFVLIPLIGNKIRIPSITNLGQLNRQKIIYYRRIKELEFDLESNRINQEQYIELKEKLMVKVSSIINKINNLS